MNLVYFPGLGLHFNLERVAFTLFGKPFYWYGIIIGIGFLLALLYCMQQAPKYGISGDEFSDMSFFVVPAALIGARLYFVLFYMDNFRTANGGFDVLKMLRIWDGGVAIYGGVIGGALVALVFCKVRKLNFFALADVTVCGLLIGQIIGRWGNFINIEVYGRDTTLPWRMGVYEWTNGVWMPREVHPTFLYESLWNLLGLIIIVLIARRGRKFDGQNFYSYLLWYGAGRAVIEGLRDPAQNLFLGSTGIQISQLVGILSALVGAALLIYHLAIRHHTPEELYVNRIKEATENDSDGRKEPVGETEDGDSL